MSERKTLVFVQTLFNFLKSIMCEHNFTDTIRKILSARKPKLIQNSRSCCKHAGVLIPLFKDEGVHKVLLTKRSLTVEYHKGQISFPGGSVEREDTSLEETALRETQEETGLRREDIEILGRIDDTMTLESNFLVHPFVGLVPYPYNFTISEAEVEKLIKVPLEIFHPGKYMDNGHLFESKGKAYSTLTYEYDNEVIRGATARMMNNFMDILGDRQF